MICKACIYCCFFFFSSRRRHTRFDCDWSSDVCSSDLGPSSPTPASGSSGPPTTSAPHPCARPASRRSSPTASFGSPSSPGGPCRRSEEHTSELQSQSNLVCRLLLEKKKKKVLSRCPILTLT